MTINARNLTKSWIDFLKRNQIVQLTSAPDGKLIYKKSVTKSDLQRFLRNTAEFDEGAINDAIRTVLGRKATGKEAPKLQNNPQQQEPSTQQKQIGTQIKKLGNDVPAAPKKKYANTDATDINFKNIDEAIRDSAVVEIGEDDVEKIFNILVAPKPDATPAAPPAVDQDAVHTKKIEELNKIKRVIRDTMTDAQRKALWRILTDE